MPLCLALWPVWVWYYQRFSDRSDEPLGIVALLTFVALLWSSPGKISRAAPSLAVGALLIVYGVSLSYAPKLVQAGLGVATVGLFLTGRKFARGLTIGDWGLLFLSLPIVASLNFYAGYPLRLLVCDMAVPLLRIDGFVVVAQGTALIYNGQAIEIDAPCSGIRMLWASLYLAATLASLRTMGVTKGASFMILAVMAAIIANVLRVTSLFYLEIGTISLPVQIQQVVHEGAGAAVFFLLAIGLLLLAGRLAGDHKEDSSAITGSALTLSANEHGEELIPATVKSPAQLIFFLACLVCAILPLFLPGQAAAPVRAAMPTPSSGWPLSFSGEDLRPVPLSARGAELAAGFPGEIKVFACGRQTVIFRSIEQATRRLHPAADCYRAGGYEIKYYPFYTDLRGLRWGATEAIRGAERLQIRERIFDDRGNSWTDVSTWYWAALMGKTAGPWWSVVTVGSAQGD